MKLKSPTASVCIVTYNNESDIEPCIQAVLQQTYTVERIVVVDNASSDKTCEVVRCFGHPVQLIANKTNTGFAPAQNQAISRTDSDYVLVLNPDVVLDSRYLAVLIDLMEKRKDIGSATGQLVLASEPNLIDTTGITVDRFRRAADRGTREPVEQWQESGEVFGVSGAATESAAGDEVRGSLRVES